jgi:hypothetical protein
MEVMVPRAWEAVQGLDFQMHEGSRQLEDVVR